MMSEVLAPCSLFFFFFFFIVNVKQTFISGAKPEDMLVKTVAGLC